MKDLGDDFELEAGRVRRKQAAENGSSRVYLDRGRSPLAVLDFEETRNVVESDRRRVSQGKGAEH